MLTSRDGTYIASECICGNETPICFQSMFGQIQYRIKCYSCGLAGQWKDSEIKAIQNWNEIVNRISFTLTHVNESVYLKVRKIYGKE